MPTWKLSSRCQEVWSRDGRALAHRFAERDLPGPHVPSTILPSRAPARKTLPRQEGGCWPAVLHTLLQGRNGWLELSRTTSAAPRAVSAPIVRPRQQETRVSCQSCRCPQPPLPPSCQLRHLCLPSEALPPARGW